MENEEKEDPNKEIGAINAYLIGKLKENIMKKLAEIGSLELFNNIEMPLIEVLADMQFNGIYVNKDELVEYGERVKQSIEKLTKEIYDIAGEEFNINSTKQLGEVLFEKLKLPAIKKNKTGYTIEDWDY